jgi:hypothetical protein
MLLGRNLVPFTTPPQASGAFRPSMPRTHFYSNMRPFGVMAPRRATNAAWYPTAPNAIGPAPSMPVAPPAPPTPMTPGAAASPIPPTAAMHGAFGSTGGVKAHFHMNPYTVMREGLIPGVHPNANHLRWGVRHAHSVVHQSMPFQTAPLPPPPPPPPPPVAVAPGGTKGFFGALFGRPMHHRARHRHWWQLNPPSTEEQSVAVASNDGCEWVPNSVTGISKQICNGHVVAYKDAQGNVQRPGDYGAYPETSMSGGFGFPGFRRFAQYGQRPGGMPYPRHHRHHHYQPYSEVPSTPAPVPQFGGYWR